MHVACSAAWWNLCGRDLASLSLGWCYRSHFEYLHVGIGSGVYHVPAIMPFDAIDEAQHIKWAAGVGMCVLFGLEFTIIRARRIFDSMHEFLNYNDLYVVYAHSPVGVSSQPHCVVQLASEDKYHKRGCIVPA